MKIKNNEKEFSFADLFIKYKGKWVALNETESKVMGVGTTVEQAVKAAQRNGVKVPIMFRVPKRLGYFGGFSDDISNDGFGVLGQDGFFSMFDVKFSLKKKEVRLYPVSG